MVKLVKKTDCSIPTLHERSKLVDQSIDKALVLNNYFHSCFSTSQPPLVGIIDRLEPGNCPSNILCTEEEVFDLVASLDISKSTGPDGVSTKMLKGTATSITYSYSISRFRKELSPIIGRLLELCLYPRILMNHCLRTIDLYLFYR